MSDHDPRRFLPHPPFTTERPRPSHTGGSLEPEILDFEDLEPEEAEPATREGLPPGYRMRHDAHYVEQLALTPGGAPLRQVAVKDIEPRRAATGSDTGTLADSVARFGLLQPLLVRRRGDRFELIAGAKRLAAAVAAGLDTVPCLVHEGDDAHVRALAAAENLRDARDARPKKYAPAGHEPLAAAAREVTESVSTLRSSLGLISEQRLPIRDRIALAIVRSEAHRAAWLAQAAVVLAASPSVVSRHLDPSAVAEHTLAELQADLRLAGVMVSLDRGDAAARALADEALVKLALVCGLTAVAGLVRTRTDQTVRVEVGIRAASGLVYFDLSQRVAPAPDAAPAQPAGDEAVSWPGGHDAVVGITVARRIVLAHGGRLDLTPIKPSGCRISLGFPADRR